MGYTKSIYRRHLQAHDYDTGAHKYIRVIDKKVAGTAGGPSGATTWNVRDLTDIDVNTGSVASLDTNKVKLPAGTYMAKVTAPAHGAVGVHRVALVDVTASPEVKLCVGGTLSGLANAVQPAVVSGMFTLAEESEIEVRHYTANAIVTNGLGLPADVDSDDEIYTIAEFWMEQDPAAETLV